MKLQVLSSFLAVLSHQNLWALAQSRNGGQNGVDIYENYVGNNLTIAFYGANGSCANGGGQPPSTISLTTPNYPADITCINIDEIFTQGNDSGRIVGFPAPDPFSGVNYTLAGRELYQPNMNYTGVWIKSTNITGVGEGLAGGRWVRVYQSRDCRDVDPYFSLSCQTPEGGSCFSRPNGFRSFSLGQGYNSVRINDGKCEAFTPHNVNAASMLSGRASLLIAGLTIITALWMSM